VSRYYFISKTAHTGRERAKRPHMSVGREHGFMNIESMSVMSQSLISQNSGLQWPTLQSGVCS